ncbi:MAG: hypothetical protein KUG76_02535 [Gammaproteobacteria bacterium]|nr:hypothetical protein [Gammaproteobacteria bacterium]
MRFLCCAHRDELSKNPNQAINVWQDGFDTGKIFFEQKQWHDALPQLGCAFETAEIIFTSRAVEARDASDIFAHSSILLARVFAELGYINQSLEVLLLAIERIELELIHQPDTKVWLNISLQTIYDALDSPLFMKNNTAPLPHRATRSARLAIH